MNLIPRFLIEAQQDIDDAWQWYETQLTGLGDEFMLELRDLIDRICLSPRSFPIDLHASRKAVMNRFPYLIFFQFDTEYVTVLAVYHSSRKPGKWSARFTG